MPEKQINKGIEYIKSAPQIRVVFEGDIPNPAKLPVGRRFHTRSRFEHAKDLCKIPIQLCKAYPGRFIACYKWQSLED